MRRRRDNWGQKKWQMVRKIFFDIWKMFLEIWKHFLEIWKFFLEIWIMDIGTYSRIFGYLENIPGWRQNYLGCLDGYGNICHGQRCSQSAHFVFYVSRFDCTPCIPDDLLAILRKRISSEKDEKCL